MDADLDTAIEETEAVENVLVHTRKALERSVMPNILTLLSI